MTRIKKKQSTSTKRGRRTEDDSIENSILDEEEDHEKSDDEAVKAQDTSDLIAELSESILENPDAAFFASSVEHNSAGDDRGSSGKKEKPKQAPSKMAQLLVMAGRQGSYRDEYTAQLAIMSLLAIFKDLIPSYRIRLPTSAEQSVKVSKETKKVWDYEAALLQSYQQYLQLLEKTWAKSSKVTSSPSSISITSILCLCELLKTAFHFNFRSNLLTAVVRNMNAGSSNDVSRACCEAIEHVFHHDSQGEVALEAARQVAKLIKDRDFRVRATVLKTFAALPLRVYADEAEAAKIATKANAKKRKRDKETAAIEAELKEGQATVDKILLARCQADTLEAVTMTYFRILKSDDLSASHVEELLPVALEGLAKFAHLINIDTVMDVLAVIKDLLKKIDAIPLDAALNCILTAFETLQGPGKELKIDQKDYIVLLYRQLPRLCTDGTTSRHVDAVLKCLTAAFLKRREFSTSRITAFVKLIFTVSMHTPPHVSAPLIALARLIMQRYPSTLNLLENEQDIITAGEYSPDVDDPEHSNPFTTSAWELATLKFHIHSQIADQAQAAATQKLLQIPSEGPEKLHTELAKQRDELHILYDAVPKKHPLHAKPGDSQRQNVRFIKPRFGTKHFQPERLLVDDGVLTK